VGTEELLPEVWRREVKAKPLVARQRVFDYGRLLVKERSVWRENDWTEGLELHFEVFDRMDRLRMLSVSGPLALRYDQEREITNLLIPAGPRVEVRGSAFSVASRDPEHNRFKHVGDFLDKCHRAEFPCSLCVRVMVRDTRTGRMALLWEEKKDVRRRWEELDAHSVLQDPWLDEALFHCSFFGGFLTSPDIISSELKCRIEFYLAPVPSEEHQQHQQYQQQRLWRLFGGGGRS
jgi:hypothetical protein